VNPIILQDCAEVNVLGFKDNAKRRKFCDVANHSENTTIGGHRGERDGEADAIVSVLEEMEG
jgi:hypothetical protein